MKNRLFTIAAMSICFGINAQVGINTNQGQATLDVVGFPTTTSKPDGIIAPRLSLSQLAAKTYASAQTGAIVYVNSINATPAGSTINVTAPGYYYFDGTLWVFITPSDWHITGNSGTTAATVAVGNTISSGNFLGTKDSQNLVLATVGEAKGILGTDGTFRGGNASTAGPYASFVWGSNNTLSDTTISSSIVLGKDNTVSALGANTPGVAIGSGNYVINGAKAIGNNNGVRVSDGSIQNLSGANALAFGNNNYGVGFSFGNQNSSSGYAIGTGNTVAANGYAFGNANTANATRAMVFGISGTASVGDQTVYTNTSHVFFGQGNATTTIVGINMAPTAAAATGAAIQMKGIATAGGGGCTSADEGAIRYNTTIHAHEGCNGTVWKALY
ncbi:hypothetical protein N0B40_18695 [Chryseobacterium oranimense]|uniref:hypothetical protein n=1 Tax=Chryseobacterium oranimense TaxID=421058 RepID=UPI0021AEA93B|nr:hypothetical protein [Chryseobacterium oranimense]UWX60407.1 hypothetical protein N0B40_18695 [Chryseobacterium oranimense]